MPTADANKYDSFSVALHWGIALLVMTLFASGLWMVDLDYYHPWYYLAPWWHKGLGITLFTLVFIRLAWSLFRKNPKAIITIPKWQRHVAKLTHKFMSLLIIFICLAGYFIVTAKGDALTVFDWFDIPAIVQHHSEWTDLAGSIHLWGAYGLIMIAVLHALAAFKHHFVDKDATLWRILGLDKGDKV